MLEWLRQNMRDMNRTVKWVMKKKQVKSMKENKGGANYEGQDGASERLMVKLRPLGFRVRLVNGTELRGLN